MSQEATIEQPELPLSAPEQPQLMSSTYAHILACVKMHAPMAAHEFQERLAPGGLGYSCRQFVGHTEATISRRMREMVVKGWLMVGRRKLQNGHYCAEYSPAI